MTNVWPNGSLTIPRVSSEFNPARRNPVTGVVQPHNGIDLIGFDAIISPVTGVVTVAGYNGAAGIEVRIREDGTNDTIRLLHNRAVNVRVGQRVSQGQTVAWMGSTGQSTGPHCHEETRPGGGNPINPRDWYARRNSSTAGGGSKPFEPLKDETMTVAILLNNAHFFTVGEEFLSHNENQAQADITRQVNSIQDELHRLDTTSFFNYLDGMGIPRSVVDINTGAVLNPQSGKMERNGVWSRRREAVALAEATAARLEVLAKALTATPEPKK